MDATFSNERLRPPLGFRIPFNAESGEAIEERWRNWRRYDSIDLKSLRGITIDCGWRDQYHIHFGSRILSQRHAEAGIRNRYEKFDDDRSDINYRMDVCLPFSLPALMR